MPARSGMVRNFDFVPGQLHWYITAKLVMGPLDLPPDRKITDDLNPLPCQIITL